MCQSVNHHTHILSISARARSCISVNSPISAGGDCSGGGDHLGQRQEREASNHTSIDTPLISLIIHLGQSAQPYTSQRIIHPTPKQFFLGRRRTSQAKEGRSPRAKRNVSGREKGEPRYVHQVHHQSQAEEIITLPREEEEASSRMSIDTSSISVSYYVST